MTRICGIRALAMAAIFCLAGSRVQAGTVTWFLSDVTFSDSATAVGQFTYNADTNALTAFNISVTGSSFFPTGFDFTPADSSSFSVSATGFDLANFSNPVMPELLLSFTTAMTDAGGTIPLTTGVTGDCWTVNGGSPCGTVSGGDITTASSAPEPASLPLLGGGVLALGLIVGRKRLATAAHPNLN